MNLSSEKLDSKFALKNATCTATTWSALFAEPVPRRALLIGAGTAFFQQANGSEAAVYYVPQVLQAAGVRSEHSQLQAAALVGLCKLLCIVIGQFSVDRYGRRVMLLSSIAAVTASLLLLVWCLGSGAGGAGLTLAALCFFMVGFSIQVLAHCQLKGLKNHHF